MIGRWNEWADALGVGGKDGQVRVDLIKGGRKG